jgi:hypothetical protein
VANDEQKKLRAKLLASQAQPVPLRVAASVVHQQISGSSGDSKVDGYDAVLDSTALALSHVSDIYYVNAQGRLLRIPDEELAVGRFEGGAAQFRTRSGNVYEALSMRRADMADAITILKKAHTAVHAAGVTDREEDKKN